MLISSNVPAPPVVHSDEEAPPPVTPLSGTVCPAQIVWSGPAFTVAAGEV